MNYAWIHLVSNHLPIALVLGGLLILILGALFKVNAYTRLGLAAFVFAALSAIVVTASGEEAEDVVKKIHPGVEQYLEDHEEAGETAATGCYILGALALVGLAVTRRSSGISRDGRVVGVFGVGSLIVLLLVAQAAHLGGQIAHPEVRAGAAVGGGAEGDND